MILEICLSAVFLFAGVLFLLSLSEREVGQGLLVMATNCFVMLSLFILAIYFGLSVAVKLMLGEQL
ncbi:MAG TPA: hypothetical protein VIH30_08635 [Aquirhabdus sp.]